MRKSYPVDDLVKGQIDRIKKYYNLKDDSQVVLTALSILDKTLAAKMRETA